jgi:hypothetical protein
MRQCIRCDAALVYGGNVRGVVRPGHCRPCSKTVYNIIRRWMDADTEITATEFGADLGLSQAAMHARMARIRRGLA